MTAVCDHDAPPMEPENQTPANQTDEEFGNVGKGQRDGDHPKVRSDTPRGSEVETRNSSNRRG